MHSACRVFADLAAGKTLPEAIYSSSSLLVNRPTCDQTADRRRVKGIPVLRTDVAQIIRIDISTGVQ